MTRRTGIIAALAGVAAAIQLDEVWGMPPPSKTAPSLVLAVGKGAIETLTIILDPSPSTFSGKEEITLTAQEIMDALAGRVKPNHCPACGLDAGPYKRPTMISKMEAAGEGMARVTGYAPYGPTQNLTTCARCTAVFVRTAAE
jgi:hypothetical protein